MDVSKALRRGSSFSNLWEIEGFSADYYNALFVTPLRGSAISENPPRHLLCILEESDEDLATLFSASYPSRSETEVLESSIEQIGHRVVTGLETWTEKRDLGSLLSHLTVGSRFHIGRRGTPEEAEIWLCPNLEVERRYLTLSRLKQLWSGFAFPYPPLLRLEDLSSIRRLHDSVSVVRLPGGERAVFKGAVRVVARMYHELRELLRMPAHPNIIGRPRNIVTCRIRGRDELVVCGFILDYHSGGTLLKRLKLASNPHDKSLSPENKAKWVLQLTRALQHMHSHGLYYCDLRLDNIVLTNTNDVVIIDFEQCGSARRWLHPRAWHKVDTEKDDEGNKEEPTWAESSINPVRMPRGVFYSNPPSGYFRPFAGASDVDRQVMANYSLAKVMWCIFEEQINENTISDLSIKADDLSIGRQLVTFPCFLKAPWRIRYWIWLCTRISPEWGGKVCPCSSHGLDLDICGQTGARMHNGGASGPTIAETLAYLEASLDLQG